MKTIVLSILTAFCVTSSFAQVGIGVAIPDKSAQLEVASENKGFLMPRLTKFQRGAIPAPLAKGLLVYQTDDVDGFYYYDGNKWQYLGAGWGLKGNSGTDPNVNFIGTIDPVDLRFKVSNLASGIIGVNGNIGLGLGSLSANTGTQVTAFGFNSLSRNTATGNAAFGYGALASNTSAAANTAVGYLSLNANNSGFASSNTAVGYYSLVSNTSGSSNTALGAEAMFNSKTGSNNTAVGNRALNANENGFDNTAIGYNALFKSASASNNIAIGNYALSEHTTGGGNTAIGYNALRNRVTNSLNTVLGYGADAKDGLTNATAIGANALTEASNSLILGAVGTQVGIGTTAPHNSALLEMASINKGLLIPRMTMSQRDNIAVAPAKPATGLLVYQIDNQPNYPIGFYYYDGAAWQQLGNSWGLNGNSGTTTAHYIGTKDFRDLNFKVFNQAAGFIGVTKSLTSFGLGALASNTGSTSVAFGQAALSKNTSGFANAAFGDKALENNLSGDNNTAVGYNALQAAAITSSNTAVGSQALSKLTSFTSNTAIGNLALANANSAANTAVGASALQNTTTGRRNTAIGNNALYNNLTGSNNIGIGWSAMNDQTSGDGNVVIGFDANTTITSGSNNTIIGNSATVSVDGLTNATAIGYQARVSASNTIQLGNTFISKVITSGWVDALGFTATSDRRFKSQVRSDVKGLDFIMELKPVTYLFDEQKLADYRDGKVKASELNSYIAPVSYREGSLERRTGFIAQQVEQAAKQVGYAFDGVRIPKNESEIYTLSYSTFVVPLVKAVQEQQAEIESLREKIKKSEEEKKEQTQKVADLQNTQQQLFERVKKLEAKIR